MSGGKGEQTVTVRQERPPQTFWRRLLRGVLPEGVTSIRDGLARRLQDSDIGCQVIVQSAEAEGVVRCSRMRKRPQLKDIEAYMGKQELDALSVTPQQRLHLADMTS